MANRWCDGFGRYGGTEAHMLNGSSGQAWAQVDTDAISLSSANPRTGSWHLRISDPVNALLYYQARRVFGAPLEEVFIGMAVYCHDLPSSEPATNLDAPGHFLFSVRDQANSAQFTIWLGTDGALEAREGSVGAVLGRTEPIIGAGAYQHIEIYALAGDADDGALEIRVDEVTKLNLTGITTVQSANIEFSQFSTGYSNQAYSAMIDIADCYVNDTVDDGSACDTWVGDCKSGVLMVNADTAQADFTKSTGTVGYELLDETPANDSDYIETASSTAESDFGIADGPASLSEVLTVRPFVRALKDDAGTCTIAPNMKSDGTKGTVDSQPITTAPAYYDSNVPLDPDTGVPWVLSGLNAALHVVERTA